MGSVFETINVAQCTHGSKEWCQQCHSEQHCLCYLGDSMCRLSSVPRQALQARCPYGKWAKVQPHQYAYSLPGVGNVGTFASRHWHFIRYMFGWLKTPALTREVGKDQTPPVCVQLERVQQPVGGIGLLMLCHSHCYLWSTHQPIPRSLQVTCQGGCSMGTRQSCDKSSPYQLSFCV